MAGAMVGLAMAVAAVLAERWPSAGDAGVAAGVSACFMADVGADQGLGRGDVMAAPGKARWHLGRLARAQRPWLRRRNKVRP